MTDQVMTVLQKYLIVTAHGEARVTSRRPRLRYDEVAFPLTIRIPATWGRIYGGLPVEVAVPDLPDPSVQPHGPVTGPTWGEIPEPEVEEGG